MSENKNKILDDFTIGGMYYKTTLTEKFKNRKQYKEPDINLIKAFIPGTIVDIMVKQGQKVSNGEPLLLLEAMKMRNIIIAPQDGKIKKLWVKKNDLVSRDQLLVEMD
ncbi:MAG TPA: acetyl-CoA carboxylase biotin carboxyl carrier protein subunit [Bacteroidetes bacterium]|nr:acetyl-CoA carboxylase biotin carboxyl carrier protein subunit [Bacteroidota bacterium]